MKEGIQHFSVSMPEDKRTKLQDLLARPEWAETAGFQTMKQLQVLAGVVQFQSLTSQAMAAVLPAFWQAMPTTRPGYVSPPGDAAARAAVLDELGEAIALLRVIANAAWAVGDHFTAPLLNVLSPLELLRRVPWIRRRFFASDATGEDPRIDTTPSVMAVTDFTAATWYAAATHDFFDKLTERCGRSDDKLIVYIAELLPIVALACQRAGTWTGEIVVAITDNDNCRWAINRRRSRNRYARYLLQILTLLEVKYRFRLVAYYVNTHNNVLNDTISRVFDAASDSAIEDTQEVIDKMVTGLEYESLDEMITFSHLRRTR